MLFNSLSYIIFLPIIALAYFQTNKKQRWIVLLAASYYFYASINAEFVVLIVISTIVDYLAARGISNTENKLKKKGYLISSLFVNLCLLFTFKYWNFFNTSIDSLLSVIGIPFDPFITSLILPVGISFYTFQTLAYTIDVYRGRIKAEKHLGIFAVYVAFFPQLVAGPIERAQNLIPQLKEEKHFSNENLKNGLKIFIWGLFKKMVVADRLSIIVNTVYAQPDQYTFIPLFLATIFFGFQIYCDFSGYSDMAIGSARILGFKLMNNFRRPYFSKSVSEFWRRWHISLSTWFKDYIYIPLGGNRVSKGKWRLNIFIVFLISGIWHGAAWTFIFWGSLHGLYIIIEDYFGSRFSKQVRIPEGIINFSKMIFTFFIVNITWVFFRAESFVDVLTIFSNMTIFSLNTIGVRLGVDMMGLWIALSLLVFMELVHILQETRIAQSLRNSPKMVSSYYILLILLILLFGIFEPQEFIYFQF